MKSITKIIATIAIVLPAIASARSIQPMPPIFPDVVGEYEMELTHVSPTQGRVLEMKKEILYPHCPPGRYCTLDSEATHQVAAMPRPRIHVRAEITLNGCMDRIAPVTFTHQRQQYTGRTQIFISALNLHNEASRRVRCFRMPVEIIELSVPVNFDTNVEDVDVIFLNQSNVADKELI